MNIISSYTLEKEKQQADSFDTQFILQTKEMILHIDFFTFPSLQNIFVSFECK